MSKNINVNPGQYKIKGRERQGEDVVASAHKSNFAKSRKKALPKRKGDKKR